MVWWYVGGVGLVCIKFKKELSDGMRGWVGDFFAGVALRFRSMSFSCG